ncbi:MAG: HutD family protein [Alphaproteobacteria bacterium]|nr:HutD family protein [Alphaproteobacteria bacterium]
MTFIRSKFRKSDVKVNDDMIDYLKKQNYILMPWKNGQGMTRELAMVPHSPKRDDSPFLWRISIAAVTDDGPFSVFPNIDRHLMLIEGNGITLDGGEQGMGMLFEDLQVYSFPGDIEVSGKLADGPIRDFNVMVDRRYAKADLTGFYLNVPEKLSLRADVHFIHLLEGSSPVVFDLDGSLTVMSGGDSLKIENEKGLATIMQMEEGGGPSAVAFVSIDMINQNG